MTCGSNIPGRHNTVLFWLFAHSPEAEEIIRSPENAHLRPQVQDGTLALQIGNRRSRINNKDTVATIGRRNDAADIVVPEPDISRIHCSFELNADGDCLVLYDKSSTGITQIYGDRVLGIDGRRTPRRVALVPSKEAILGIGLRRLEPGEEKDPEEPDIHGCRAFTYRIKFKLVWHCSYEDAASKIKFRAAYNLDDTPQFSRTLEFAETSAPSNIQTAARTPNRRTFHTRLRCVPIGDPIGFGTFGSVTKALDIDNCRYVAAKRIHQGLQDIRRTEQEIYRLSSFFHPHIVSYLGWADGHIYMELLHGNLEDLVKTFWFEEWFRFQNPSSATQKTGLAIRDEAAYIRMIAMRVLDHIARALVYLHNLGIIHRDIKPANILFLWRDGTPTLKICDFGLSNEVTNAASYVGSPPYMAPEIGTGEKQTFAVDIWSLFVVFVWLFDIDGFRGFITKQRSTQQLHDAIQRASRDSFVYNFHLMVEHDPSKRPTAEQLLTYSETANGKVPLTVPCQPPEIMKQVSSNSMLPETARRKSGGIRKRRAPLRRSRPRIGPNAGGIPGAFPISQ